MHRSTLGIALAIALILPFSPAARAAEPCTRDTLRKVVDEAGARLRVITAETQPRMQTALRRLKEKRGWTDADGDAKAAALMSDARTAELDTKSATLLALIDELGETGASGPADCSRLAELEAAALELQATVKARALHILARIEQATGEPAPSAAATAKPTAPAAPPTPASPPAAAESKPVAPNIIAKVPPEAEPRAKEAPAPAPKTAPAAKPEAPLRRADEAPAYTPHAPPAPAHPAPVPAPPAQSKLAAPATPPSPPAKAKPAAPTSNWSTEMSERPLAPLPAPAPTPETYPAPPALSDLPPVNAEPSRTFTQDEIREASRGFFGTISSGLAGVMEHAFSTLGRPTGYVLGNEGGGAFIAGVRYGSGTLFLRDGRKRDVYWHGPSIGYDFGASGSKTMFLVYNLEDDLDIFTGFSGVEGSAYLVGGVGMTVLTNGRIVMAPIRSGLGVRIGANLGYIRFTARPTWNPF
jgi:hypothetical protein